LRFDARSLPLFPEGNHPYSRHAKWGTLVKLFEYQLPKRSHILMKDGLLSRLDILLAEPALPIRLHECRDYKGHAGSFANNLMGIKVRLSDNRASNLEPEFPLEASINVNGKELPVTIYAFPPKRHDTYKTGEGVAFTVNGQTHGVFSDRFFARKAVGLSAIRQSLLTIVECSDLEGRAREDLFMNSRDRLLDSEIKREIERQLEQLLAHHPALRNLREERRRKEIDERLADDQSLTDVLENVLSRTRSLSQLFVSGSHISNPFTPKQVKGLETEFKGKRFPTYFHYKGRKGKTTIARSAPINVRPRVEFETDAENSYFHRDQEPGRLTVESQIIGAGGSSTPPIYTMNLYNGIASVHLSLPKDAHVGDSIRYQFVVDDDSRVHPFKSELTLTVIDAQKSPPASPVRRKPPTDNPGDDRDAPTRLQLPNCITVHEDDDHWNALHFDRQTALAIRHQPTTDDSGHSIDAFDFFVNADNIHLRRYQKYDLPKHSDPAIAEKQFEISMVLVGLAKIHHWQVKNELNDDADISELEDEVWATAEALAPFMLPMIEALSMVDEDELVLD
jgi:hypothetical protein